MTPTVMLTDDLTGLIRRKPLMKILTEQVSTSQNSEAPFSLAFLDIDNFATINEIWGHRGGDLVLQAIARVISDLAGETALAGRYGGDEYVILFPGVERERAFLILERIRSLVEATMVATGESQAEITGITITGGVASFPVDGRTQAELMRKAQQALYRAKVTGRNNIRLAYEERMVTKTTHFTMTQLERLTRLSEGRNVGEADLLREALDDLLAKYETTDIDR